MSFSGTVKEEIAKHISGARHCQLAELAAIIQFCGRFGKDENGEDIFIIDTENEAVKIKYFTLLKKTFNIDTAKKLDNDTIWNVLQAVKVVDGNGVMHSLDEPINAVLLKQSCCKRAYLRGAYLCIGSMSDPKGSYHLEMVCDTMKQAKQICEVLAYFNLDGRIIERKRHFVVYMKEGAAIVDFLNICEAHVALMEMENERIFKEVRNSINRRVNCEAANITKTVNASTKQVAEIELLRDEYGLYNLPPNLREMAEVRLEHPEATLAELGEYLNPPVGKSGVNHRLRRLSEIAQHL
ncbi:MAG: DNA-binding protein WhiA [Lachnospiraceae bacterium]|nr:DNA-binding protein WhiA [Candidatus Colinaster scatohippi]